MRISILILEFKGLKLCPPPFGSCMIVFSFIQSFKKFGVRNVPIHFEILVTFHGLGGLGSKDNSKSFDTFEIVVPLFNLASLLM